MGHQQPYWSHLQKSGQGSHSCRICTNPQGLNRKYGFKVCRQCSHQYVKDINFVKLD
ncbi:small ribosomal subunit protein uS14-like [Oryctolagus cuniculus]|uniref:Small ribosomal subunit protein uS14 n=1 Tax=Oryctolagus cuniculus TaxID=9986 RepID=A0A5F9C2Z3_RABIT|nr:40S ribosomal protein S29-like [Oryctolagus cuniculus]